MPGPNARVDGNSRAGRPVLIVQSKSYMDEVEEKLDLERKLVDLSRHKYLFSPFQSRADLRNTFLAPFVMPVVNTLVILKHLASMLINILQATLSLFTLDLRGFKNHLTNAGKELLFCLYTVLDTVIDAIVDTLLIITRTVASIGHAVSSGASAAKGFFSKKSKAEAEAEARAEKPVKP